MFKATIAKMEPTLADTCVTVNVMKQLLGLLLLWTLTGCITVQTPTPVTQRLEADTPSTPEVLPPSNLEVPPSNAQSDIPEPSGNWVLTSGNDDDGTQFFLNDTSMLYQNNQVKFWQKGTVPLSGESFESYIFADCSTGAFQIQRFRKFNGTNLVSDSNPRLVRQATPGTHQGNLIEFVCSRR